MSTLQDLRNIGQEAAPDNAPSNLIPRTIEVRVDCTYRGEEKTCSVSSTVPNAKARQQISRSIAQQSGGLLWESFAEGDRLRMLALATIAHQVADIPDWLSTALEEDDAILFALYEGVDAHTARYFLGDLDESAEAPQKPRVAVTLPGWPASSGS